MLVDFVADRGMALGTLARLTIGSAPRRVRERIRWADWGPDGNSMAIVQDVGGRDRLEYPIGTMLYETPGSISMVRVSPDGERVAFSEHPLRGDIRGWIKVVDRAGSVVSLAGEDAAQYGLAWSPDGTSVVFSASTGELDQPTWVRRVYSVPASGRAPAELLLDAPGGLNVNDVNARGICLPVGLTLAPASWFNYRALSRTQSFMDVRLVCAVRCPVTAAWLRSSATKAREQAGRARHSPQKN